MIASQAQHSMIDLTRALTDSVTQQSELAWGSAARLLDSGIQRQTQAGAAAASAAQYWHDMTATQGWATYLRDLAQRTVLQLDTLRTRGDQYLAYEASGEPPLLAFDYDTVVDATTLPRPVNYYLVQIKPAEGVDVRPDAQPFVIVDPRAGHGAGIGGSKAASEVGVALAAGHPVYFVLFSAMPVPDQTLDDVGAAEAHFLQTVAARHPDSPRPCVIGNCQGGWAVMALAAACPDLMGMIVSNGAPLSYWAGAEGQNPMRYLGGLLGGSWTAHLAADLGHGLFDGAYLVSNFERLNPANTYWSKYAKLFMNIDSEAPRFLEFERWWSGYVYMTRPEIETIVDELFVGNALTRTSAHSGRGLDLRKITAPIVVFCSQGDNITPPQQALDWIVDLYPDDDALAASGQTIVYLKHASSGHLGIFVSASVAQLQHKAIVNASEAIQRLPPGLHEMEIEAVADPEAGQRIVFIRRHIADIRALNPDQREIEPEFAAVRKLSDLNLKLYETLAQPWVRACVGEPIAAAVRAMHPLRLGHRLFSSQNPWLALIAPVAQQVRAQREPLPQAHPGRQMEALTTQTVTSLWNTYRDLRDAATATLFHALYAPAAALMQGMASSPDGVSAGLEGTPLSQDALERLAREGDYAAAVVRIFLLAARLRGQIEKTTLTQLHAACDQLPEFAEVAAGERRRVVQTQALLVERDPLLARNTLAALLPDAAQREQALLTVADLYRQLGLAGNPQLQSAWAELCRELVHPDLVQPDLPAHAQPKRNGKTRGKDAPHLHLAGKA